MSLTRNDFISILGGAAAIQNSTIGLAAPGTNYDSPTLNHISSNKMSVEIAVTAGASGAPAGFEVEWMSLNDFAANGNSWYQPQDPRLSVATFRGKDRASLYSLTSGETVSIRLGDLTFDEGVSSNSVFALDCSSEYLVRAFALADNRGGRSTGGQAIAVGTLLCPAECPMAPNCTYDLQHWKTSTSWPLSTLSIGSRSYGEGDLARILNQSSDGFGLIALAQQLIAAKLNAAKGADVSEISDDILLADVTIGNRVLTGKVALSNATTFALVISLTNFNNGATGPGSCC